MPSLHVIFDNPVIASNTGNAIRLAAVTGARLHLVEPLGFNFEDKHLRRAGLDYHDLADLVIHPDLDTCLASLPGSRVFAFTTGASRFYTDVAYEDGDALLFGTEPTGLPDEHLAHPRISDQLRIPMKPARRSMNLANSAAVATFEAWRQMGFEGGV
ncbi:tRNA (uridine(34)/cytosine(34)/5-carboxymethylaminomethyluridine(34)-2'-O)-methyltransferase TrmL [Corynebacterium yudongzhengii]|uniref:Putative tRNA (cytidine(34)-2'-O)-methyltransferase n=1 Tax=Corynebacterium yudongzhengii TaxID=2080740 RepID=A0A2U1T6Z8_9CORY|nr:tRNA (cytidine(34)-2'-O)-methyltransferase [Corynebacterium yudongzhengii]AWB81333.1 tRNA (uridine(34)/cytosine(34)/5-carboxymethylaminomethyluridine(34)-2'-O)-methyltransferase TrmL [Corynebacterium yudongzhengii]PWC01776.1 tRNA (cytidine(34)-2'-O)-methyltransferase [Corynebacterium yudongzhengii]